MTTENTQPENSDVDVSVAEQSPVSENEPVSTPTSPENAVPVEAQIEGETDQSSEHQNPQKEESSGEPPVVQDLQPAEPTGIEEIVKPEPDTVITQQEALVESSVPVVSEEMLPEEEKIIRSFADYLEEFRQSEAFVGAQFIAPEFIVPPEAGISIPSTSQEETLMPPAEETVGGIGEIGEGGKTEEATGEPVAQVTKPATPEVPESTTPAERPVSPLLRPAPRSRQSRHGGRQREEIHAAGVAQTQPQQEPEAAATPAESTAPTAPTVLAVPTVSEVAAPVEERPRPARRYRFDRPAPASNGSPVSTPAPGGAPSAQVRSEESKETGMPLEQKQPAGQEPIAAESETPPVPDQERRRSRGKDQQREKERTAPAPEPAVPVAEAGAPATEGAVPETAEVPPEDLPPLEYSELRAASSRRRRRRRPGSSPATPTTPTVVTPPAVPTPLAAKPVAPEPPSPPAVVPPLAVPPVAVPRNVTPPGTIVTPVSQYNLISGYTVNQMNQGDGGGPFMGPEPSPARGSTSIREGRSMRSEVQRVPAYPPVRHGEHSGTAVSHLANVMAQALQAQTDRIVAELHRVNHTPANVSVSFPPLPSTERVGVFVDVANLLYSARTLRITIDFGKLLDFLRGNRRLVRAHAYCPTSPQPGEDQMFLQAVKGLGYRITTKNYKTFSSGAKKADLDLDLCMDVVRLVEGKAVDSVVLVSGDSDFMPMLDYCSDHGVRVEVAAFDEAMSATLRQSCDLFINLSMLEEIRA